MKGLPQFVVRPKSKLRRKRLRDNNNDLIKRLKIEPVIKPIGQKIRPVVKPKRNNSL
jgi:hypothetical protein